jgi:hypothetical protein
MAWKHRDVKLARVSRETFDRHLPAFDLFPDTKLREDDAKNVLHAVLPCNPSQAKRRQPKQFGTQLQRIAL